MVDLIVPDPKAESYLLIKGGHHSEILRKKGDRVRFRAKGRRTLSVVSRPGVASFIFRLQFKDGARRSDCLVSGVPGDPRGLNVQFNKAPDTLVTFDP